MSRYCARGVCDRTEVKTHASWRPPVNSTHTWILKYLLNVITGLSDVSGDVIFICFLFSLQLLTAVHPFLSNHCFTVFLQLSVFSPHTYNSLQPSLTFLHLSTAVSFHTSPFSQAPHRCKNTTLAFLPVSLKCIPSSSECKVLYKLYGSAILFLCFFGLNALNGSRFGSFPLAVAVSIWWAVGRKVEAPSRSSFLLSLQIATKA